MSASAAVAAAAMADDDAVHPLVQCLLHPLPASARACALQWILVAQRELGLAAVVSAEGGGATTGASISPLRMSVALR